MARHYKYADWYGLGNYRGVLSGLYWDDPTLSATSASFWCRALAASQSNSGYTAFARIGYQSPSGNYQSDANFASVNHPGTDWADQVYNDAAFNFPRQATAYTVRAWGYSGFSPQWGGDVSSDPITIPAIWTPWAPTNVIATRNSDTQNTVSWTNGSGGEGSPQKYIERQIDGGGWTRVGTAAAGATSWIDTSTAQDHSYRYRVQSEWHGQLSAYATSGTVSNTPIAPGKPVMSRTSATAVSATLTNTSKVATALEWQRSSDATNWSAATSVSGQPVTSFTDNPGGGTWYYRARNKNGSLVSAWSAVSDPIVTIIAPAAPTLTSPQSGALMTTATSPLTFSWTHNPLDGSAQTVAQFRDSKDNGATWFTADITGNVQSYSRANGFPANSTVLWQVRTKGAHADWSPWSTNGLFYVKAVPQLSISSPTNGQVIDTLPLTIAWQFSDQSGTQASAKVEIRQNGQLRYSKTITGTASSLLIAAKDFLPDNNATFDITVMVTSTSTLTATASQTFATDYVPPDTPSGTIIIDNDTLSASILAVAGMDTTVPATVKLGVFRQRADGTLLSLADNIDNDTTVTDHYPPIDVDLTYIITAYTETGVTSNFEIPLRINSLGSMTFNFGSDLRQVARLMLNPDWSYSKKSDSVTYQTAGAKQPLVFYGTPQEMSGSVSGVVPRNPNQMLPRISLLSAFEALRDWTGYAVMRMPQEDTAKAVDCQVSFKRMSSEFTDISINWLEVRGHGLVS